MKIEKPNDIRNAYVGCQEWYGGQIWAINVKKNKKHGHVAEFKIYYNPYSKDIDEIERNKWIMFDVGKFKEVPMKKLNKFFAKNGIGLD